MGTSDLLGATGRAATVIGMPVVEGDARIAVGLVAWLAVSVAVSLAIGATIRRREREGRLTGRRPSRRRQ
jgi:hypothetical protein